MGTSFHTAVVKAAGTFLFQLFLSMKCLYDFFCLLFSLNGKV